MPLPQPNAMPIPIVPTIACVAMIVASTRASIQIHAATEPSVMRKIINRFANVRAVSPEVP